MKKIFIVFAGKLDVELFNGIAKEIVDYYKRENFEIRVALLNNVPDVNKLLAQEVKIDIVIFKSGDKSSRNLVSDVGSLSSNTECMGIDEVSNVKKFLPKLNELIIRIFSAEEHMKHIGNIHGTEIGVFMEGGISLYRKVSCLIGGKEIKIKGTAINSDEAKRLAEAYLKEKGLI